MEWLELRSYLFCNRLAAANGIFHRVVVPLPLRSGSVDVSRFQVVEEVLQVGLAVLIKNDVRALDVQVQAREDAIAGPQQTALLQVSDGSDVSFRRIRLLAGPIRDFDVHRTGSVR